MNGCLTLGAGMLLIVSARPKTTLSLSRRHAPPVGARGGTLEHASIGPSRVVERLGAGGMGEVDLAIDTRHNWRVAPKYLSDPTLGPPRSC